MAARTMEPPWNKGRTADQYLRSFNIFASIKSEDTVQLVAPEFVRCILDKQSGKSRMLRIGYLILWGKVTSKKTTSLLHVTCFLLYL